MQALNWSSLELTLSKYYVNSNCIQTLIWSWLELTFYKYYVNSKCIQTLIWSWLELTFYKYYVNSNWIKTHTWSSLELTFFKYYVNSNCWWCIVNILQQWCSHYCLPILQKLVHQMGNVYIINNILKKTFNLNTYCRGGSRISS